VRAAIPQVYLPQKKLLGRWVEAATERVVATSFMGEILAIALSGVRINHRRRKRGPGQGHLGKIGYKTGILLFNIVPCIALYIVG
jgi:hypothetical protein